jgi:hypothetical protein
MSLDSNALASEAERAELASVVEALARWPRLSQLLRYMGEKVFSGKTDELNEYEIATEVLGRSKTQFNAGEDAIARVETHRLRKRLAEFYRSEGKDHPIQVTLPSGSYVPVFVHKSADESGASLPNVAPAAESESGERGGRISSWITPTWKVLAFAAGILLLTLSAYLYFRTRAAPTAATAGNIAASSASMSFQPGTASSAVRLLAGYSGPPRTDSAGRIWSPDQYFAGGGSWQRAPAFIARTSDQFLFEHSRTGDFNYNIPLKPGSYELHLFFSTPARANESTSFNVFVNAKSLMVGFDINLDALGENIADQRVFRDISPDKDGFVRLGFTGATGPPTLNAIEILPGVPRAQLPIRLIMQTTPMIDSKGRQWQPDSYFMSGRLSAQTHPLLDSSDPDLFSGERYGHFTYAIPVDTRDRYTIVLHFAELYFGSGAQGGAGSRVFKVMCNGETLLDNFDILKEAGNLHELSKTFRHVKPTAMGKLDLTFEPIVNNATISGIEVLDEAQ